MTEDKVYFVSGDGVVHALDLRSGVEVWSSALGAAVGSATPLMIEGQIVLGDVDGVMHALDATTGLERWAYAAGGAITGAAASDGITVFAGSTNGQAFGLGADGGEAWRSQLSNGVSRSVALWEGIVYLGCGGSAVALDSGDGTLLWQTQLAQHGEGGTPSIAAGTVFASTGIGTDDVDSKGIAALDARTGELAWRYASPRQAQLYTPAVSDGRAFVVGQDALVVALDALTGSVQWSVDMAGPVSALPSVTDGVLYVAGDEGQVAALDGATGRILWSAQLLEGKPYSPVVIGGYILVGTSSGILYGLTDQAK